MAVSIGGCGDGDRAADVEGVATYEAYGDGGDLALLEGSLVVDADCVYVLGPDGGRLLPVFPSDEVRRTGDTVELRGDELSDGDEVSLSGGGQEPSALDQEGYRVPDGCDTTLPVWIVGQD